MVPAYKQVMKILPQLVWLGTPVETRYRHILDVAGVVSTEAASNAISAQDYALALEWLEEGRSIVWQQMLQLRTPIDEIFTVDPSLAKQLKQVAHDLDYASFPKLIEKTGSSDDTTLEQAAQLHRQLARQWEHLVERARGLPGFEAFLRPQRASDLMRSARTGPVVVINIFRSNCNALIIQPGVPEISHISLDFSFEKAKASRMQMLQFVRGRGLDVRGIRVHRPEPKDEFRRALGVLWKDIVKPVLEFLGYLVCNMVSYEKCCSPDPLSW